MQAHRSPAFRSLPAGGAASLALLLVGLRGASLGQVPTSPSIYGDWVVGHQVVSAGPDSGARRAMDIDIWFPTDAEQSTLSPTNYDGKTARFAFDTDQAAAGRQFPLIVYSHGWGGSPLANSYFAESMASHGFVVASTKHFDTSVQSAAVERPQDVSSVIDVMLANNAIADQDLSGLIDEESIGVAGFSIGGFTAMATAAGITVGNVTVPPDDRVRAIMPIAKAIPSDPGLIEADVTIPALMFVGKEDSSISNVRSDLPVMSSLSKYAVFVEDAGHLDVGQAYCQQSPMETACPNDDVLRVEALYGVAFFSKFLKDDDSFNNVLTQSYSTNYEPLAEFWDTGIADTDRDGKTTLADFAYLKEQFGAKGNLSRAERLADFNNDKAVDLKDFSILKKNFSGGMGAAAAVPEPTGIMLMGTSSLLTVVFGRRRLGRSTPARGRRVSPVL